MTENSTNAVMCQRCVMDSSVPEFELDDQGICNYCHLHDALHGAFPQGEQGRQELHKILDQAKAEGRNKDFDCIVGVSGGTDSMYLLHYLKKAGMRPLAVNLDNGFHTEIAVANIKKVIDKLGVELQTYVINYDEMADILLSHMRAGLAWIDGPTDIAIVSSLYKIAAEEGVKYVFVGNNFRTEGRQPTEWTHTDGKLLSHVQKKFGRRPLDTFPNLTLFDYIKYTVIKRIKMVKPLYYLNFNKSEAMEMLKETYDWRYYGGHHHESVFTRFSIGCWMFQKFGIDKRKVTLSALIRSGEKAKDDALKELAEPPYDLSKMAEDKEYIAKKLGITGEEFDRIWQGANRDFHEYPSYYPIYNTYPKFFSWAMKWLFPTRPMMTFELKQSKESETSGVSATPPMKQVSEQSGRL